LFGVSVVAQRTAVDEVYTVAQAARGKTVYEQRCAECHLDDLRGSTGPELAGRNFINAWGGRATRELFELIKGTMPPGAQGSLSDQDYIDVVAYILQANGRRAGAQDLRRDSNAAVGAGASGSTPELAVRQSAESGGAQSAHPEQAGSPGATLPFVNREASTFTPVTDHMLRHPPPGEWLMWRRTLDAHGYSPLKQVSPATIQNLRLAWVWAMNEGSNLAPPLVHDGIMFLANPGNIIQALDARTGDLIWEFRRFPGAAPRGQTRSIALYQHHIFTTTSDGAVVALDARSGKVVWETRKFDQQQGFSHTGGPIIAGGVVVSGVNGCRRFGEGCFITGHDPTSGRELWRTSTIALPGDPNDASWGTLPADLRSGGDTWIPGSYDPHLNLFYIGTAQAKPWVPVSRGLTPSDAVLYTNSTLALDPKTGKIVWYFQHVPAEALDLDTVFERVLVDVDGRRVLFTVGKDGLMWKLDRQTGSFIGVRETILQNIFDTIDSTTGRLRYRSDIIEATIGKWISACPSYWGGHNWPAAAFVPETNALVVPLHQSCFEMKPRPIELVKGSGGYGGDVRFFEMPGSNGNLGRLTAFDVRTMEQLWTHEQRAMLTTAALTTGGGLVFVGDADRYFKAFDVRTGKVVWQTRLGTAVHGFPITYSVDGRQYIAVPTGMGAFRGPTRLLSPEIYPPTNGTAVYVFSLAERP
jgi:alcohol dehydrogenase (cytochrome c)